MKKFAIAYTTDYDCKLKIDFVEAKNEIEVLKKFIESLCVEYEGPDHIGKMRLFLWDLDICVGIKELP